MDRPYIICHMLVSYDNKITGGLMFSPETSGLIGEYGCINREFNAQAWLCGKTTMEEFTGGLQPDGTIKAKFSKEDYVAKKDVGQYVVVTDAMGEIGYAKPYLEKGGRKSYIIELLTYGVSDEYVAYLRKIGISYIFAGEKELDLNLSMKKLKTLFGIELLISHGGSYINSRLFEAGLIDELSLVRVSLIEDNDKEISLFGSKEMQQSIFTLKSIKKFGNSGDWLRYLIK